MSVQKTTFSAARDADFFRVLRQRVDNYFKSNNISKNGDWRMFIKTAFMFSLLFGPYAFMLIAQPINPGVVLAMWMLMGFGMAGIGLGVMHDACHGSYSKKKWVNNLFSYSMNLIGGNAEIWKLQHNVLHHSYTNIEGQDDDINPPEIVRFSPHKKLRSFHKFQFLYIWFLYGISTLSWVTSKEFIQLNRYKGRGYIKGNDYNKILAQLILWKALYWTIMLIVPILVLPYNGWFIFGGYILMHFTAGLTMSLIFQTAHVMPECEYPLPDETGKIDNNWAVHQLQTTTNYAPNNRILSWLVGGLNYQVEHHLFPQICHIHYKKLSAIVADTAKEYGVPYYSRPSFSAALFYHTQMLYKLGRV